MKYTLFIVALFIGLQSFSSVDAEEKVQMWNSFMETSLTQSVCLQIGERVLKSAGFSGVFRSDTFSYHGTTETYIGSVVCSHNGTAFFVVVGPDPNELSRLRSKMMHDFKKNIEALTK